MAEKNTFGVLDNAVFAYAKLAEPTKKYQSEDTLYEVDCIVTKAVAKAFNKEFAKQKAKEYDREDFEAKFKMDAPYEGDEIYVIKLRKPASKDGEVYDEKFRPKVLLDTVDDDGEAVRVDITTSRLISNGSVGKASYRVTSNDFGTFAQLNNILMDDAGFIEYKSSGGGVAGSEFGDSKPIKVEPAKESATKARANKPEPEEKPVAKKPAKKVELADDDQPPF